MKIILASASPRRSDLLNQVGIKFKVQISNVEEKITSYNPKEIVKNLSFQKAEDIFYKNSGDILVVGCDTIVCIDNKILGKPVDKTDAYKKLKLLQGKHHRVYTGVTVFYRISDKANSISFCEESKVFMEEMSDKQIVSYIDTKEPMDKAGAYAIQGIGALYIKKIEGDYNNIVGLPIARLYKECLNLGIDLKDLN